jgi:hypothetical protein
VVDIDHTWKTKRRRPKNQFDHNHHCREESYGAQGAETTAMASLLMTPQGTAKKGNRSEARNIERAKKLQ